METREIISMDYSKYIALAKLLVALIELTIIRYMDLRSLAPNDIPLLLAEIDGTIDSRISIFMSVVLAKRILYLNFLSKFIRLREHIRFSLIGSLMK